MSKRNYKRLVKKQSIIYRNRIAGQEEANESQISELRDYIEPEEDIEYCFENSSVPKLLLREKLKKWYYETSPSRKSLEMLLAILVEEGLDVPLSASALLGARQEISIKKLFPGSYCHVGIKHQFEKLKEVLKNYDEIEVDLNVDGIPLFKSSRIQLWPILLKIVNIRENIKPFPVGIYIGHAKPACVKEFFKDFVDEVILLKNEFTLNDKNIKFSFRCLTCDTPAKAFVCGVPGHTSSHGCTKCTQVSQKIGNVLTYSAVSGTLITDIDFSARKYPKHHSKIFQNEKTPLEEIGFNMVTKYTAEKRYNNLMEILAEHKVLLDRLTTQNAVTANILNIFPINSEEKLKEFNNIFQTQPDPFMRQIKILFGGNVERNFHQVFGTEIIMNFNVDGNFGKKRLKDYGNVYKALIDVISALSESADKTLRAAFQRQKKKVFKQNSRNKTKNSKDSDSSEKE